MGNLAINDYDDEEDDDDGDYDDCGVDNNDEVSTMQKRLGTRGAANALQKIWLS